MKLKASSSRVLLWGSLLLSLTTGLFADGNRYYLNDHLATTVGTSDAAGEIAALEADAFGAPIDAGQAPSRYTGKPYDDDLGAFVFPFRNYRPEEARWMSADPSGFPDGVNGLAYSPNPNSEIDPLGLLKNYTALVRADGSPATTQFAWSVLSLLGFSTREVLATYQIYQATTNDNSNVILVYKFLSGAETIKGYDFSYNCHGFTFTGGAYYVEGQSVQTILSGDGYKLIPSNGDFSNARVGVWGTDTHSATVTAATPSAVTQVRGKLGGISEPRTSSPSGQGYAGNITYYE
jgi:RHS repeat-associated protein